MKKRFSVVLIGLTLFSLAITSCATSSNTSNGEYIGAIVWVITESDFNTYTAASGAVAGGQPKPTALGAIPVTAFGNIPNEFSVDFMKPRDYNPDRHDDTIDGWWNFDQTVSPIDIPSSDYYVIIQWQFYRNGDVEWHFLYDGNREGKVYTGLGNTPAKISIAGTMASFRLSDFKNPSELSQ
jgi:hypothetical protein